VHPLMQRFSRGRSLEQLRDDFGELLDLAPVDRLQHRLSGRKVPIQGTNADARATRNFFERDARADLREGGFRSINEQQPIAGSVRARFAPLGGGFGFGVD